MLLKSVGTAANWVGCLIKVLILDFRSDIPFDNTWVFDCCPCSLMSLLYSKVSFVNKPGLRDDSL